MTDDVDAVEAVDDGEAVEGTEEAEVVDEAGSLEDAEADEAFADAEDFDPVGTAVLIAIYMAIVAGMWVFTYFVEFLGRGVSIVG